MNDKELSLFNEKTMTIKEVAEGLKVSRQLINEKAKEYFPEIIKNGIETKLTERQVTIIKLSIEKNPNLPSTTVEGMPKTDLEMQLKALEVMQWMNSKVHELQKQNIELKNIIEEDKPKIETYERLIDSDGLYGMDQAAKALNMGRNILFSILRDRKILMENNTPYQQFCTAGYFEIKLKTIMTGETKPVTKVTPKGIIFIEKTLNKINIERWNNDNF